jgi:NADH-quinone oxidoreductase subunit L
MESYAQLAPLMILLPSMGAFINIFWGAKLPERISSLIAQVASGLTFVVAVLLYAYLVGNNFQAAVINPPFLSTWITLPGGGVEISWQQRVDTLSVTMMLFVSFVATLIHIYAAGYMHGDARFYRFFAYLNMFIAFMFILVTGNNLLMMFVGWEGVGLCSFLLISFWWDKAHGVGWRNSLAARKAFILNRVGDFGLMLAVFLTFWTFGTLDFFRAGEVAHVGYTGAVHSEASTEGEGEHSEASTDAAHSEASTDAAHSEASTEGEGETHSEASTEGEGDAHSTAAVIFPTDNSQITDVSQLGIFGQADYYLKKGAADPSQIFTKQIGPITLDLPTILTLITLFMLVGAAGKSAQIPLFVWLPDAMAGPTPVSALIHAATMVTAGVYMMVRSNVFFYNAPITSTVVTVIGVLTALVAGYIAMGQWDIKRVLAYSTISQLGFMVAAVGIGAYGAALFHMITHAFFKALLFLGSGSVIHGMEHGHHHAHAHPHSGGGGGHDTHGHDSHAHEAHGHDSHDDHAAEHHSDFDPQDMRNMGGLAGKMPITFITYLIGTLALAGIWPLAGFWSKDEILVDALNVSLETGANNLAGYIALGGLVVAAGFTAFYMWRQIEMVFFGKARTEAARHVPESVPSMTVPLVILAVCSVFIGFINIPGGFFVPALGLQGLFSEHALTNFIGWSVAKVHVAEFNWPLALFATAIGVGAIVLARTIYGANKSVVDAGENSGQDPLQKNPATAMIWNVAHARMYWDQIYGAVFEQPFNRAAALMADKLDWAFLHDYFHDKLIKRGFDGMGNLLSKPVDLGLIDGVVLGVGKVGQWLGGFLRQGQKGYVRGYALFVVLGVVIVIVLVFFPLIRSLFGG